MTDIEKAEAWVNKNYYANENGELFKIVTKLNGGFLTSICKDDLIAAFIAGSEENK
jgi:hypothetical protein